MKRSGAILISMLMLFIVSCGSSGDGGSHKPPVTGNQWTIMIYLDADNDLSSWANLDIREMMEVGSTKNITLILQLDGRNVTTKRYKVEKGSLILLSDLGELDMADGETLRNFVSDTVTAYPAAHYALIIWDHGQGWKGTAATKSIFNDYDNGKFNTYLSNYYIAAALSEARSETGVKLDILGIDACNMSVIEAAYEFRDAADIMIASQELVSAYGWDYDDLFRRLDRHPDQTPAELAGNMVDSFRDYYARSPYANQTITAIALDKKYSLDGKADITTLAAAVNNLALSLSALMADEATRDATLDLLMVSRAHVREFEYIYVDLIDFCSGIAGNDSAVEQEFNKILMAEYHGAEQTDAHGLSIVFFDRSTPGDELVYDPSYRNFDEETLTGSLIAFINEFNWDEMMHEYFALQYPDLPNVTP
ncbi:MAG: clostripain-related cysteine peptidase [Smithella sp.]|nr:clostripain-related cysteine peptidase [Smithella sp.]HQI74012.1 clostripain-related cysteine peptidase [Smithella sp.]